MLKTGFSGLWFISQHRLGLVGEREAQPLQITVDLPNRRTYRTNNASITE